ncbi:MAG: hypothetical protein ACXVW6_08305 [Nocardioidaceae bacterium]
MSTRTRPWTDDERRGQLRDFASHCELLADMATSLVGPGTAEPYVAAAAEARRLLAEGFEQEQLDDLAGAFPELPGTFNPRALDTGAGVTGAEQELAEARDELAEAAQLLRSPGAEDG